MTRSQEEILPFERMKLAWVKYDGEIGGQTVKPSKSTSAFFSLCLFLSAPSGYVHLMLIFSLCLQSCMF